MSGLFDGVSGLALVAGLGLLVQEDIGNVGLDVNAAWWTSPIYRASDGSTPAVIADLQRQLYAVPQLGPELVPNGDFADPTTSGWTTNGTNQLSIVDNALRITTAGTPSFPRATRNITTEVGKTYFVSVRARKVSGVNNAALDIYTSATKFIKSIGTTSSTTFVTLSGYFTAATTSTQLFLFTGSGASTDGDATEYDNISVREVMLGDVGVELITNGDFATNLNGWTDASSAPATVTHSSASALFTISGGQTPRLRQSIGTEIGSTYTLICRQSAAAAGTNLFVSVGTTAGGTDNVPSTAVAGVAATGWNTFSFVATATTTWINFVGSGTSTANLDDVSVRKFTPRPTLRAATFSDVYTLGATRGASNPATYIDAAGVMQTVTTSDVPRFDYSTGTGAALVENASTNWCTSSSGRVSASTTGGALSAAVGCYSLLAASFTETAVTSTHGYQPNALRTATVGQNYTTSCYVFAGLRTFVQLTYASAAFGASQYCNFELAGAGVASPQGGTTATITALTGAAAGWYRLTYTAAATVATGVFCQIGGITSIAAARVQTYAGDTSAAAFTVCGFQIEENQSYATSLIPTTTASVSRNIESYRFSPLVENIVQRGAFTVKLDAVMLNANTTEKTPLGTTITDQALIRTSSATANLIVGMLASGNISQTRASAGNFATRFKCARSGDSGRQEISIDNQAATGSSVGPPLRTTFYMGRRDNSSTQFGDGLYFGFVLYPNRVTSAALQGLAT